MAALITADTWLGASGWARGSHTCSGTMPGLASRTRRSAATKATDADAEPGVHAAPSPSNAGPARGRGQDGEPEQEQHEAEMGHDRVPQGGRAHRGAPAWSASTSTVEATAISSQHSRNETTSPAARHQLQRQQEHRAAPTRRCARRPGPARSRSRRPRPRAPTAPGHHHEEAAEPVRVEARPGRTATPSAASTDRARRPSASTPVTAPATPTPRDGERPRPRARRRARRSTAAATATAGQHELGQQAHLDERSPSGHPAQRRDDRGRARAGSPAPRGRRRPRRSTGPATP